jgi:phage tail-like protein
MPPTRVDPFTNIRFRVEIDGMKGAGALEVVFPEAQIATGADAYGHLTLRRGLTTSDEWYKWWDDARRSKTPPRRTVKVILIDEHGADANRWVFGGSCPFRYHVSSLNALGNEIMTETLELVVGGFEAIYGPHKP